LGFNGLRSGRAGKVLLAASVMVAGLAMVLVANVPASLRGAGGRFSGSIGSSQYPVDGNITVANYSAPGFTWSEPVTFTFTVDSNITANVTVFLVSDMVDTIVYNMNVVAGLNPLVLMMSVIQTTLPGSHFVNVTFSHGNSSVLIVHEIWVGSNPIISYSVLFGALGFVLAIYVKVGAPKKAKSSSSGTSGSAASAADDDASTVTYVDQSQAPPGRIYCPECKKVIEEGSIFCPECGTRIPRYLRYHP
jgi:hypothetical protein